MDEFQRNLAKAEKTTSARREDDLRVALNLYHGDYLEDIYSEWAEELRASLRREYFQALEDLARYCRSRGRLDDAAEYCHRLLDKDILREDIHRELIGTLIELGDRAGASRQFERLRQVLYEELGAVPSSETMDLVRRLQSDD